MFGREFLTKNKIVIMYQPSYSTDLAPANFFLFPKLKMPMKGKRFAKIEEIKEKSKQKLFVRKAQNCGFYLCQCEISINVNKSLVVLLLPVYLLIRYFLYCTLLYFSLVGSVLAYYM